MISTGIKGLDEILTGLRSGDNVVWQIDNIEDYRSFVVPYVKEALGKNKKVVYMRFADHKPLLDGSEKIKEYKLNAASGFENFTTQVNNIITEEGKDTYYVFDCLSDLLSAWATDLMIENFFVVTCPYLFELDTFTYFAIMRNSLSFKAIARIRETTQLLIDVYHCKDKYYIHPLKVWNRYTPTMFLPHIKERDKFIPITDSVNASEALCYITQQGAGFAKRNLDYWDRLFLDAEDLLNPEPDQKELDKMVDKLCRIMITKDERMFSLVKENITLLDLINIKARLIGTGLIGGKAVGMLLSRKILSKDKKINWQKIVEPHDSFYIGSDVFYAYIVRNGLWKLRMQQKIKEHYFEAANVLREKMLFGKFPGEIMEKFRQMIEYFGTSPIIVRSSSLLEDGYGNAFSGKYESIFCANQGTPEQRYLQFVEAVKKVYASTMNEDALTYRRQRGLDMLDEQMALLVQRVSGSYHKHYFFPDLAGVGISYNTYVWSPEMDPKAGMLRLVFGLGTRAVDRVEGDYPRTVALDAPLLKPHADMEDMKKFSQRDVDLINVGDNLFQTVSFTNLLSEKLDIDVSRIAIRDHEASRLMERHGKGRKEYWILTFDKLLSDKIFLNTIKQLLKTLEANYKYPVDIEFTINFINDNDFKINLLQCRPLQTQGLGRAVEIPKDIDDSKVLFKSGSDFFGGNISQVIKRVIYINPKKYIELKLTNKYDIARTVGNLNKQIKDRETEPVLLMGPGRWGTSTPSLGVPVNFREINNIAALVEMSYPSGNLMPELSFGTHFFQDLVETNIFYVALFLEKDNVILNKSLLTSKKNLFEELVPEFRVYKDVIGVYDVNEEDLRIMSDVLNQEVVCFNKI